jgi:hypothetical protein
LNWHSGQVVKAPRSDAAWNWAWQAGHWHVGIGDPREVIAQVYRAGDNEAMAMTEAEWLACRNQEIMLTWLKHQGSKRKFALFACACCRRIWHLIADERKCRAVELVELIDLGLERRDEWEALCIVLRSAASPSIEGLTQEENKWRQSAEALAATTITCHEPGGNADWAAMLAANVQAADDHDWALVLARNAAHYAGLAAITARTGSIPSGESERDWKAFWHKVGQAREAELRPQSNLVRDILGNPFRPVALNPAWRTSNVTALAQSIYNDRAFERLPILADALEDAGCDNADILNHCRQPAEHVRGCWIVDLILGKE